MGGSSLLPSWTWRIAQGYAEIAEVAGLAPGNDEAIVCAYIAVGAPELKEDGGFKLAGLLAMKLKKGAAAPGRKGMSLS